MPTTRTRKDAPDENKGFVFASDVPSTVTESECAELARLARDGCVLELGSLYGRSTIALAAVADVVHAVDWHLGDEQAGYARTAEAFLNNLYRYQLRDQVVVHIGRFEDVLPVLAPATFDLCFIDGLHTEAAVNHDYQQALRLVRTGGYICFHDYGVDKEGFGVTGAVDLIKGARSFHTVDKLAVLRT